MFFSESRSTKDSFFCATTKVLRQYKALKSLGDVANLLPNYSYDFTMAKSEIDNVVDYSEKVPDFLRGCFTKKPTSLMKSLFSVLVILVSLKKE